MAQKFRRKDLVPKRPGVSFSATHVKHVGSDTGSGIVTIFLICGEISKIVTFTPTLLE